MFRAHEYDHGSPQLYPSDSSSARAYDHEYNYDYDWNYEYDRDPLISGHGYIPYEISDHRLPPYRYHSSYGLNPSLSQPIPHPQGYYPTHPPIRRSISHPHGHLMRPILPPSPHPPPTRPLPSSRRSSQSAHIHHPILPSPRRPSNEGPHVRGIKRPNTYTPRPDYDYSPSNYRIIREGGWAGMKAFMEAHGLDISKMEDVTEAERLLAGYAELDSRMRGGNGKGRKRHDVDSTQDCEDPEERGEHEPNNYNIQKGRQKMNHKQPAVSDPDPDLDSCDELGCDSTSCLSRTPMKAASSRNAGSNGALDEALATLKLVGQESNLPSPPPCAPSPPPACATAISTPTSYNSDEDEDEESSKSETKSPGPGHDESIPIQRPFTNKANSEPKLKTNPGYQIPSIYVPNNTPPSPANKQDPQNQQNAPPASLSRQLTLTSVPPADYEENDAYSSSDEYIGPKMRTTANHDCIDPLYSSPSSTSSSLVSLSRVTYATAFDSEEEEEEEGSTCGVEGGVAEGRIAGTGEYINEYIRGGRGDGDGDRRAKVQDWTEYRVRLW